MTIDPAGEEDDAREAGGNSDEQQAAATKTQHPAKAGHDDFDPNDGPE